MEQLVDVYDPPLDQRVEIDEAARDTQLVRTRNQIRLYRDETGRPVRVTANRAEYTTGLSSSGHRWWSWGSKAGVLVRRTASGRTIVVNFEGARAMTRSAHSPAQCQVADFDLRGVVTEHLGEPLSFRECYPLAMHYENFEAVDDPQFRTAFERVDDVRELTARLYGRRAVRKSLVKAVAGADIVKLYLSWCLRGRHVPVDWHVDFLRSQAPVQTTVCGGMRDLRPHLRVLDRTTVRRLMRADRIEYLVWDLRRMRTGTVVTHARSWQDLHDRIARNDRRLRLAEEDEKEERARRRHQRLMDSPEYQARLAEAERRRLEAERQRVEALGKGAEVCDVLASGLDRATTPSGLRLTVARSIRDLLEWGETMDNCIGSYGREMMDRTSLLACVHDGSRMVANLQVRIRSVWSDPAAEPTFDLRLVQCLGPNNRSLGNGVQAEIDTVLHEHGVRTGREQLALAG